MALRPLLSRRALGRWSVDLVRRFYCSGAGPSDQQNIGGSVSAGQLGKLPDRRLYLSFKCGPCGAPVQKWLSKQAYEQGVVIVTCDGCRNRHLIADNLGWFPDIDRAKLPKLQKIKMEAADSAGKDSVDDCSTPTGDGHKTENQT